MFLPKESALDGFREVLRLQQAAGHVSYLGVLKRHRPDDFLLTHGLDGWSLAMDFKVTAQNRESLWSATDEMTRAVLERGGRFYFAKDAVIGRRTAEAMYELAKLEAFRALKGQLDPDGTLETDLWRRVFAPDAPDAITAAAGAAPRH